MGFRVQLATNYWERMFADGVMYTDGEREARNNLELQRMLMAHGATEYHAWAGTQRHRLEPVPGGGHDDEQDNSLDALVREAKLAVEVGTQFNPMLLLGKQFGVSGHQPAPFYDDYPEIPDEGPFSELSIDQISNQIRLYAAIAAREILATGVEVSVWDLGQEIDTGIAGVHPSPIPAEGEENLFGDDDDDEDGDSGPMFGRAEWYPPPDGVDPEIGRMTTTRLDEMPKEEAAAWCEKHVWPHQAQILASAAEGIRSVDPTAKVSSHITFYPNTIESFVPRFWRAMWAGGYKPDQLGFTVFPSAAGAPWVVPSMTATEGWALQKAKMVDLMAEFGVPVMMTEFAYPCGYAAEGNFLFGWVYPVDGYPLTEDGQKRFVEDTAAWAKAEGVAGIRYWGVEWCFGEGDVQVWRDMAFFRPDGKVGVARPVMRAFENALKGAGA